MGVGPSSPFPQERRRFHRESREVWEGRHGNSCFVALSCVFRWLRPVFFVRRNLNLPIPVRLFSHLFFLSLCLSLSLSPPKYRPTYESIRIHPFIYQLRIYLYIHLSVSLCLSRAKQYLTGMASIFSFARSAIPPPPLTRFLFFLRSDGHGKHTTQKTVRATGPVPRWWI